MTAAVTSATLESIIPRVGAALFTVAPLTLLWLWRSGPPPLSPRGALLIFAYVLGPLSVAMMLLRNKRLLAPVHTSVATALVAIALAGSTATAVAWLPAALMLVAGLVTMRPELAAPFITISPGGRRNAQRFHLSRKIVVVDTVSGERFPSLLKDCSETGLGLCMSGDRAAACLARNITANGLAVELGAGAEAATAVVMWHRRHGDVLHAGLAVAAREALLPLIKASAPLVEDLGAQRKMVGLVICGIWLASIPAAFLIPVLG